MAVKHINTLLNAQQHENLWILLRESYERSQDNILTCKLKGEDILEIMELLQ